MSHEPEVLEEAAQDPMEHMNQAQNPMVHHSPPPPPPPPPIQPAYYPVEQLSPFTVATPYGLTAFQPVQYLRHTRHTHHPHMAMRPPPAAIYVPPTAITYRPHAANQPVASGCIPVTSVGQSAPPLQYFVPSGHHILPPSLPQVCHWVSFDWFVIYLDYQRSEEGNNEEPGNTWTNLLRHLLRE